MKYIRKAAMDVANTFFRVFCVLGFLFLITSCSQSSKLPDYSDIDPSILKEVDRLSLALANKDTDALRQSLHPLLDSVDSAEFEQQVSFFVGAEIQSSQFVEHSIERDLKGPNTHYIKSEYKTDLGYVLQTFGLTENEKCCLLKYTESQSDKVSFIHRHDFSLKSLSFSKWMFLAFLILVPISMFWSYYWLFWQTEFIAKPLWAIAILLSFHGIVMNWTTGQMTFTFLPQTLDDGRTIVSFLDIGFPPGFSADRNHILSPWIVTAYFPIGVLVFWLTYW